MSMNNSATFLVTMIWIIETYIKPFKTQAFYNTFGNSFFTLNKKRWEVHVTEVQ